LKRVHVKGGVCIIHPFRESVDGEWFLSPHFHVIGYGWVSETGNNFRESKVVVKNVGIRKTLQGTLHYQLSHAGVYYGAPKKASATWFGCLSYNKLKLPRDEEEDEDVCPICGEPLVALKWVGSYVGRPPPTPEADGSEFFCDPIYWCLEGRFRD